ncbi:MAG TPA: SDR family NAD(P)-dependent oxidoreductase [Streptosporangiaceae bacterium]|nr:SDR family NAD(P)-dependent oxidoreductase [Streptosporangiaceae bacterium]
MNKWTAAAMPELTGRTAVVTGATRGIGLIVAREFAKAGARTILAVRDTAHGVRAASQLSGITEVERLDVSDLASVRDFAARWDGPLDILVNNAGIMDVPLQRTADGFDVQTATNALGPFLLTNLLLDHITDRIVWVTSQLHRMAHAHPEDLAWHDRPYKPMDAYTESKLDIVLFSYELQRRLTAAGSPVRSILAHPGIATTSLAAHSSSNFINHLPFLLNDAEHGALPTLYAATQDLPGNAYVGPRGLGSIKGYPKVRKPGRAGLDPAAASQVWAAARELTAVPALQGETDTMRGR